MRRRLTSFQHSSCYQKFIHVLSPMISLQLLSAFSTLDYFESSGIEAFEFEVNQAVKILIRITYL